MYVFVLKRVYGEFKCVCICVRRVCGEGWCLSMCEYVCECVVSDGVYACVSMFVSVW